jgi:hypothetical protein
MQSKAHDYVRNRKSTRLADMVDNLQETVKQMIEKREFYADRSKDLERKLKETAPDSLGKAVEIRTIQIADIMMELEDMHDKVDSLGEKCRKLQEEKDEQEKRHENEMQLLQKQLEIVELESKAKREQLLADLKEANDESVALEEMYRGMRVNYSNATRNIAIMASKISKLQQENTTFRVEADSSHRALVALELLQQGKSSDDSPNQAGQSLQVQLEAAQFESDKLVAERTASQSVIGELQSQVRILQAALAYQTRANHKMAATRKDLSPVSRRLDQLSEPARALSPLILSEDEERPLDRLPTMGESTTDQSTDDCSACSAVSDATPKQANTSIDLDLDEPFRLLQSPRSSEKSFSDSERARRMPIDVNGLEGNYTGPINADGLPHGNGTIRFKNGDTYLGDLEDGKLHGKGAIYFANKHKPTFRGTFVANRPSP